jgi:hypothetical protein
MGKHMDRQSPADHAYVIPIKKAAKEALDISNGTMWGCLDGEFSNSKRVVRAWEVKKNDKHLPQKILKSLGLHGTAYDKVP